MEGKGCRGDAPGCGGEQGCSGGSPLARRRWPRATAASVPWVARSRAAAWGGGMLGRRRAGAAMAGWRCLRRPSTACGWSDGLGGVRTWGWSGGFGGVTVWVDGRIGPADCVFYWAQYFAPDLLRRYFTSTRLCAYPF